LPILISVSLAPGSYFFCACAVVVAEMATATAVRATHRVVRAGIVPSLWQLIFAECRKPGERWQVRLIPPDETALLPAANYATTALTNWEFMDWN
jgi:hypothetical protein